MILKFIRRAKATSDLIAIYKLWKKNSFLRGVGWFESFNTKMPVDKNGEALPWYTYSAIAFLESRIKKPMSVFEYGSGNSTIWWNGHVSKVICCEHDKSWFLFFKSKLPAEVKILNFNLEEGGEYSKAINAYKNEFDIIVIDGRDRVNCAENSINALKPDGVIVWDNSDRLKYKPGFDYLISKGFNRIDFLGMVPINNLNSSTSVFYKKNNCLGI